jgi:hypothetical protein
MSLDQAGFTWRSGPPPHVGWWFTHHPGLVDMHMFCWRWWDGEQFSSWVSNTEWVGDRIRYLSGIKIPRYDDMTWCSYWPENARVGRYDPATGLCTGEGPRPSRLGLEAWSRMVEKTEAAMRCNDTTTGLL